MALLTPDGWSDSEVELPFGVISHCATFVNATTIIIIGGLKEGLDVDQTFFFHLSSPNSVVPGPPLSHQRKEMR